MTLTFNRRTAGMLGLTGLAIGGGIFARKFFFGAAEGREDREQAAAAAEALFRDPRDPVLGNPAGGLTIVEFYDYRCPYCIRMHALTEMLLSEDRDIRLVAKQWPVFGGPSVGAARTALAAHLQGRFAPVNDALFKVGRQLDDSKIRAAAEEGGLDLARMDADLSAQGGEIEQSLGRVAMQALSIGLQGTPAFIIGSYLVPGAMTYENLVETVAKARGRTAQQ
ncbi:DsbA family protein [Roseomonas frigidaquae]|uniref:DsbA family protein n=1 Tax=Falsiroseomonas frigidaquae TaxID=487318 RepID=A0ABX1F1U9_9PROT|nr:DsbA family protein [Falsiroseomonas frigidaquae]NKE46320.1 DsbA family protein [Falsiroseomonas frigidaquae]